MGWISFVGRVSLSVTRQDRGILLDYATLIQPTKHRFNSPLFINNNTHPPCF